MQTFLDMDLNVLPYAMSWIGMQGSLTGRDQAGRSLVYQILRSLPSLFNFTSISKSGTKRRRVDDEKLTPKLSMNWCTVSYVPRPINLPPRLRRKEMLN